MGRGKAVPDWHRVSVEGMEKEKGVKVPRKAWRMDTRGMLPEGIRAGIEEAGRGREGKEVIASQLNASTHVTDVVH